MMHKAAPLAMVVALSSAGFAVAQQADPAGNDASIRPMKLTCIELLEASEQERERIAYYVLGYRQGAMTGSAEQDSEDETADTTATIDEDVMQPAGTVEEDAPGHGARATSEPELAGAEGVVLAGPEIHGTVSREFFAAGASDLYSGCEDNPGGLAHEILQESQDAASGDSGDD